MAEGPIDRWDDVDFDFDPNPPPAPVPNPLTVCEIIPLRPPHPPGPGILSVELASAKGLSLPYPEREVWYNEPYVQKQWTPYAILEYENHQVSEEAISWGGLSFGDEGNANRLVRWRVSYGKPLNFEVLKPSELSISILARKTDDTGEEKIINLGCIRVNPFLETPDSGIWTESVQNGPGHVTFKIAYVRTYVLPLQDDSMWRILGEDPCVNLIRMRKQDSGQCYAMKTIDVTSSTSGAGIASNIRLLSDHRFIAPLKFIVDSAQELSLLSPLPSGGHLFYYLQRKHHFSIETVRLYATELVDILDHLHQNGVVFASLKPENIFLDCSGHVSFCDPAIFASPSKTQSILPPPINIPGIFEYPAPELILGQQASQGADWWNLGVLLYEMLLGTTPFYHEDTGERRSRIIGQDLRLPEGLSMAARDILSKLLDKDPSSRLGAIGAADVKAHAFFHNLDQEPAFKPIEIETVFRFEPEKPRVETPEPNILERRGNMLYEKVDDGYFDHTGMAEVGELKEKDTGDITNLPPPDEWDLGWEPECQQFYLRNRITAETRPANPAHPGPITHMPSTEKQRHRALATALKHGYSNNVVTQILEGGVNLDDYIICYDISVWVRAGIEAQLYLERTNDRIPFRPLEWATVHERLDLVDLFLNYGANANLSTRWAPLLQAVEKRNNKLVRALVRKTDRTISTRALCRAVDMQEMEIVSTLLDNGVRCDFEASDWPLPTTPLDFECMLGAGKYLGESELAIQDFMPPLFHAARRGSAGLARLLLAHGADPNAAYYGLGSCYEQQGRDGEVTTHFCCGRPLHVAMERGHLDVVEALLDGGADPCLPLPVWHAQLHQCRMVPRSVYVRVAAGLNEAAGSRG